MTDEVTEENDECPSPERDGHSYESSRRRPTLPGGLPPSTIGAGRLNFRVRDGNGCDPAAMATGNLLSRMRQRSAAAALEDSIASTSVLSIQALGRLVPVG